MMPLEELSEALGVEVLAVRRTEARPATVGVPRHHPDFRPAQAAEWWLSARLLTASGVRPATTPLGPNGAVRNPKHLNRWANRLGRRPDLPALTADDGRRVLRALYAASEAKDSQLSVGGPH